MKKNFKAFEPITNEELNEIAGGSGSNLTTWTPPPMTTTVMPISQAGNCITYAKLCRG